MGGLQGGEDLFFGPVKIKTFFCGFRKTSERSRNRYLKVVRSAGMSFTWSTTSRHFRSSSSPTKSGYTPLIKEDDRLSVQVQSNSSLISEIFPV